MKNRGKREEVIYPSERHGRAGSELKIKVTKVVKKILNAEARSTQRKREYRISNKEY